MFATWVLQHSLNQISLHERTDSNKYYDKIYRNYWAECIIIKYNSHERLTNLPAILWRVIKLTVHFPCIFFLPIWRHLILNTTRFLSIINSQRLRKPSTFSTTPAGQPSWMALWSACCPSRPSDATPPTSPLCSPPSGPSLTGSTILVKRRRS